jgi:hypothetical protein
MTVLNLIGWEHVNIPVVNDGLEYYDPDNKSAGYDVKMGRKVTRKDLPERKITV